MKKQFFYLFFIALILTGLINSPVQAIDIGGELELKSGVLYEDELHSNFWGRGELELYLPRAADFSSRAVFQGQLGNSGENKDELGFKYLYLRHRRDDGHFTIGRQPVSWAYGAMINPYDFGFGLEGLADETRTPAIDGLRSFHNLEAGRSLQLVAEFADSHYTSPDHMGYGARFRLPSAGQDLSFNLVYQPVVDILSGSRDNLLRAGGTYSGDWGQAGIYGALGYYRLRDLARDDYVAQLGLDYSWQIGPQFQERTVFLQAEYLRFLNKELGLLFFQQFADDLTIQDSGEAAGNVTDDFDQIPEVYDMLAANISIQLDPFTQVGTAFIGETGEGLMTLIPFYQSELGGGVELRIEGSLIHDFQEEIGAGISAGLSYYF